MRILADNEIRVIQPYTPFLKEGGQPGFVDVVISGSGSIWDERDGELKRISIVQAGDVIGDMGVLLKIPRTATIRSDTYMYVLRIPAMLFWEIALSLGVVDETSGQGETVLEKIWRRREIVQRSNVFGAEVPVYLQNRIAQRAAEMRLEKGHSLFDSVGEQGLFISDNVDAFTAEVDGKSIEAGLYPVYGGGFFTTGEEEIYRVLSRRGTLVLHLAIEEFGGIAEVPLFKLQLRQLAEERAIHVQRAQRLG